ncbi:nuclear pore complex protein An-Nup82 [Pseudomassariella vexata]|uniref:Nuclear pore complex protein An-Nup82 n=1 Tax=Pseudomassariella vexata TaxID=1141098 RepID=A0A1Y2EGE5_9PEZI|nr:nuclear pore complex protein An-Nup82 [Pseudomassariella vexata]ORY69865.1 nuclear pore complex protein An-Nup82 [Pseudomassariella vexata]
MPKIKSYTPAWLSQPSPGHRLFAPSSEQPRSSLASASVPRLAPRRTIARSGSQIFVAVGKEVRWADLIELKEIWHARSARGGSGSRLNREDSGGPEEEELLRAAAQDGYAGFRTIKIPVGSDIQQLIISPYAEYLAVLTTHTIRICAVPDLSYLTMPSNDVIKPKSWTLGPTTHVVNQSPIASALWHPLGVHGTALVTVTTDAVVRVWELSPTDRWSFDSPTLTIDLKKLADGTSLDQNFSATTDTRKGFSPDSFEMDVASACFAARGSGGWSPMTLWVAMREGDVYALCPLLPTRWAPPSTLIPSLSVAIVGNLAAIEDDPEVSQHAKLLAQQQLDWMSDLDNQEPTEIKHAPGEMPTEIYTRPARPGVIPKLQGPFELDLSVDSQVDSDLELSDIFVIGQKVDLNELMMGEDEEVEVDDSDREGLSLNVVCLLASSGQLRICLDSDGVQAQWLPPRNRSKVKNPLTEDAETPSLLTFQTLDILGNLETTEGGWPMFSLDITSRYAFFVTNFSSITYVSLSPWVFRLESELLGDSEAGSDFRIDLLVGGQSSTRERLYTSPVQGSTAPPLTASVAIRDPDIGYFLLSATPFEPVAIVFEAPENDFQPLLTSASPGFNVDIDVKPLDFYEPRPIFQPSHAFEESSALPSLLGRLRTSRHKAIVDQEVRLSPVTLQVFTDAHKVLSEETYRLGEAASELFRRLQTLQAELKQQITKAGEVRARVDAITGDDQNEGMETETTNAALERRLRSARERSKAISGRLERMRRTIHKATSRELSDKERAWIKEVNALDASIRGSTSSASDGRARLKQLGKRYDEAKALIDELASQAENLTKPATGDGEEDNVSASPDLRIPSELRKAKINQVRGLLERETTLVDAVKSRLERLSVDG